MTIDLTHRQRRLLAYSIPVIAVIAALLFGAIMLILLGADPIEGYSEMFVGAFGSGDALVATILKATPLLLVGTGIVIAFRANVINIGAEGQMVLGGLFATVAALYLPSMPPILMIPLVMMAGLLVQHACRSNPNARQTEHDLDRAVDDFSMFRGDDVSLSPDGSRCVSC